MNPGMTVWTGLALVAATAIGGACGGGTQGEAVLPDALADTAWRVESIGEAPVVDDTQPTLEFGEGGAVSGDGGCNRFHGSITVDAGQLRFGPFASTRRACPEPVMDQEMRYFAALEETVRMERRGPALVLLGADDAGPPRVRLVRDAPD